MNPTDLRYGFRVVGGVHELRRLALAAAAFVAHCAADPKAEPDRECYLSAFRYGADFRTYLETNNTPKGFAGLCWSPWLWLDLDRDDLAKALDDVRRLVTFLLFWYPEFDDDDILLFFSGNKGFHVGLPLTNAPAPSVAFHLVCRKLAEAIAGKAGVRIDSAIYDRVRLFRAPNSRHPKTGLHKRRFTHDELMGLSLDRIRELATEPAGFDVPTATATPPQLVTDWSDAEAAVIERRAVRATAGASDRLNRDTLEFIRHGADEGERHTRLFSAAANLREFIAPPELVHALLTEVALDSGLSPSEVRRQIDCGIAHADRPAAGGAA